VVLARELGLLALYLYRMDRDNALRVLGEIEDTVRKTAPEMLEELRGSLAAVRDAVNAGLWEDAWANYQLLADVVGKLDPVISAYVTKETREAYEKAAEPEETISYYARKVLEGERSPATPPDGLVAATRIAEQVKATEEADWERRLREALVFPAEADWERRLREYLVGLGTSGNPGSEGELVEEQREVIEMYKSWIKTCREVTEEFLDVLPGERIFEVEYLEGGRTPVRKRVRYVPEHGFSPNLLVRAMQEKCLEIVGARKATLGSSSLSSSF
jgi:hypothetical protein